MRIEWVVLRLNNWALWKSKEASGGLGFPGQSSFLREIDSGYRESIIPIDDCDASVTNDAVESLKVKRQHLYDCLQCFYVKGIGIRGTAQELGKAPSTISAQLDAADRELSAWFADRSSKKQRSCAT
jgi:hypothetical protein